MSQTTRPQIGKYTFPFLVQIGHVNMQLPTTNYHLMKKKTNAFLVGFGKYYTQTSKKGIVNVLAECENGEDYVGR